MIARTLSTCMPTIPVAALVGALLSLSSASAQSFELSWFSIDGGGAMFTTGGDFELSGTIGQADAGFLSGGDFELVTGFWAITLLDATACTGDLDGDLQVGLSDLAILLANFGTPSGALLEDGDLDGDGDVDLSDLANMLSAFGTICP